MKKQFLLYLFLFVSNFVDAQDHLFYIVHKATNSKMQVCFGPFGKPVTSRPNSNVGPCVKWQVEYNNDNYFHIRSFDADAFIRPDASYNGSPISIQPNTWTGNWTQWHFDHRGDGFGHIINRATGKQIFLSARPRANIELQPTSWRGDFTRWKFQLVEEPVVTPSPLPTPTPTLAPSIDTAEGYTYAPVIEFPLGKLPNYVELIGNGIDECCGDLSIIGSGDDSILGGFIGNGDIIRITVPQSARGLQVIGLGMANVFDVLGVEVRVDGELAEPIIPTVNSQDFFTIDEGNPDTFFITLRDPLIGGEVITLTPRETFSAGAVTHFGFYIPTVLEFGFGELPDSAFTSNGIDEGNCCGVTGPTVLDNGLLGGFTGAGDSVSIIVPPVAHLTRTIGLGMAQPFFGEVVVEISGFFTGSIFLDPNSDDFVNINTGEPDTFFLNLDFPLFEGDIITIRPAFDFSAGTGLHFGFYGYEQPAAVTRFPFSALPNGSSFRGNGLDEGAGFEGPTINSSEFGELLFGFTGFDDSIDISVPAVADGTSIIGLGLATVDNGSVDVAVNGLFVGQIILSRNSDDFLSVLFGKPGVFFLELGTPLSTGDIITINPTSNFSAGIGIDFGFYEIPLNTISIPNDQEVPLKSPGFTYAPVIEFGLAEVPEYVEFIGNDIDEGNCCGVTGPTPSDQFDGLLGFTGNGDIISITVPESAAGLQVIGLGIAAGNNGSLVYSVDVEVNGEAVNPIIPSMNSLDFVTILPDGSPDTFYTTLDQPLQGGEVITLTPSVDFSAGNLLHFGFYIPTVLEFEFSKLPDDAFIGNGVDEGNCCGVTGPTILDNGQLGGFHGIGDKVSIVVPSVAQDVNVVGLGVATGDIGGGARGAAVTVNGISVGTIQPSFNSNDFVTLNIGEPDTFFLTLGEPLNEGDVITIEPIGDFSIGTGLHFGFYGYNQPAAVVRFPFSVLPEDAFIGNGIDEGNCCGVLGPALFDEVLGGFTGVGDIVSIEVPAAANGTSIIGLGLAVGDNGGAPLGVDVARNGSFIGNIFPSQNSLDFIGVLFGEPSVFFLELDAPVSAGDVITIEPTETFSAGVGLHFGFYEIPVPLN